MTRRDSRGLSSILLDHELSRNDATESREMESVSAITAPRFLVFDGSSVKMSENLNMEDMLNELGWGDGFRIPVANEENRVIEMEIQKKQKEKDNLRSALEDVNERLAAMRKHLANIHNELNQNQNLILVQQGQVKTDENILKSSQMEDVSLSNDIKRMKKECDEINARRNNLQADINRVNTKLEKLKETAKWDQDALLAWDEEVSRGHDDMIMLEKFTREDEIKFNELELRRKNLRMELENKKLKVNNAKNDLLCMEQSLEKTAQLFRKQHADRKALVQQWEASVRILHQRDEDINRVIEEIANVKVLAKSRLKDLEEQKSFYETQVANNKELERDISTTGVESSEKKEQLRVSEESVKDLNGNLTTVQNVLDKVNAELHNLRSRKKQIAKDIHTKNALSVEAKNKLAEAQSELEKIKSKSLSAADRVKRLEDMCAEEERAIDKIDGDNKRLSNLMFQVSEQVRELKEGEKTQKSSLHNIQSNLNLIKKYMLQASQELSRQKEMLYSMDFQYMEKDIMLNKMLGLAREDNSEKYEKKIAELEESYSQLQAKNSLLSREVTRLEEERRRLTVEFQSDEKELESLKNKRQDNILLTDGGMKQLKLMKARNQDKQVDENVLKLRVRQAEKALDKVGGKLFSLEKQKLELEEAMKEREIEIKAMRDILNVRRRVLSEQATNLSGRINLGKIKVEHLKKKYEVTVGKLGTDEDGQPLSITYFKIKSAQEKFELQEIGDKLDAKIKKTENEITAMENTLKVVNASNKAFRSNLHSLDAQSPEHAEKELLEQSLVKELDELRKKKDLLEQANRETNRLEEMYNEQIRREDEMTSSWQEKKRLIAQIEKELKEQEEKLARAEKQLKRHVKEIRGNLIPKFQTIEEKDIELRELMEQNQSALQQFAELVAKTIDTGPVVTRYLSEKGIQLPMVKSPSDSIKYGSSTSLLSPSGGISLSSRSSDSPSARSLSSCQVSPSVVTLDSSRLDFSGKKDDPASVPEGLLPRTKSSVRFSEPASKNSHKK